MLLQTCGVALRPQRVRRKRRSVWPRICVLEEWHGSGMAAAACLCRSVALSVHRWEHVKSLVVRMSCARRIRVRVRVNFVIADCGVLLLWPRSVSLQQLLLQSI